MWSPSSPSQRSADAEVLSLFWWVLVGEREGSAVFVLQTLKSGKRIRLSSAEVMQKIGELFTLR